MKTTFLLGLAFIAFTPAQAQIFRSGAANGALIGGLAGAIIGNNSGSLHHNAWRGAAIGATAGLLIGSAVDDARDYRDWRGGHGRRSGPEVYVYRRAPIVHRGFYHTPRRHGHDVFYSHRSHGYPNYRTSGVFFGGVSGAIIGHNSHRFRHNAWRGAAWGGGVGYVFGTIAERNARSRVVLAQSPALALPAPAPVVQPQQVTIINHYYNAPATPMASANGLFGR